MNHLPYNPRMMFSQQAAWRKKNGLLTLYFKEKVLHWKSSEDTSNELTIYLDKIVDIKKDSKEDMKELLYVKQAAPDKGNVFSFSGGKIYLN
jgi:hypothetical protein